ncbi:PAAR domain-containing protein [Burkholderia cepacia]|uniref:PAAR domain-containing protein n=1 Tax=Burkholderia cepacia TaxID=292 RepID=UPI003A5BB1F3
MMNLICIGDDTRPRIKVETGSTSIRFDGWYVARKGDRVSCLQRAEVSPNLIEEGDSSMTDVAV